jgi:hypothetical protein
MSCELCGKNGCIKCFHSLKEQQEYEKAKELSQNKTPIQLAGELIEAENKIIELEEQIRFLNEESAGIDI